MTSSTQASPTRIAVDTEMWWDGLRAWYNHQDYAAAMETLQASISMSQALCPPSLDSSLESLKRGLDWVSDTSNASSKVEIYQSSIDDAEDISSVLLQVCRLLVFLAGCYLDARDFDLARINILQSLRVCNLQLNMLRSLQLTRNQIKETSNKSKSVSNGSLPVDGIRRLDINSQGLLCAGQPSHQPFHHPHAHQFSEIATSAIQELIASYEEDNERVNEPWLYARVLVDWAIEQEIGPWTDAFQRPGYMHKMEHSYEGVTRESKMQNETSCTQSDAKQQSLANQSQQASLKRTHCSIQKPSWCKVLEDHYAVIRDEFEHLQSQPTRVGSLSKMRPQNGTNMQHYGAGHEPVPGYPLHWPSVGAGGHRGGAGAHDSSVVRAIDNKLSDTKRDSFQHDNSQTGTTIAGDWREFVLFGAGAQPHRAPRTAAIIQRHVPEAVSLAQAGGGEVIFSVLAPRTHLLPHCGSTNLRLTAHLGLVIPKSGACIRVGADMPDWQEGKVTVFDDSYEHEVWNESDEYRAVLLLRFWHPGLPASDRNEALSRVILSKDEDELSRYNPPVPHIPSGMPTGSTTAGQPVDMAKAVRLRGLERTSCSRCGSAGYSSLRVSDESAMVCICGRRV
jgi:Aspartyl/Asparaginyl beta-hydroxylase